MGRWSTEVSNANPERTPETRDVRVGRKIRSRTRLEMRRRDANAAIHAFDR